jgi:UTP:GlnB (protein PII) uridylyltransferase
MNYLKIFIALFAFNQFSFSQNDTTIFVQVAAKLTNKNRLLHDFKVSVFKEGKCIDTIWVVNNKPKYIELKKSEIYTVFYRSNDSLEKIIIVNTNVPSIISRKIKRYKVVK